MNNKRKMKKKINMAKEKKNLACFLVHWAPSAMANG
jgi:hypothetical protein